MCGIAGELSFDGAADVALVDRMADALAPRGPDGSGAWAHGAIALGHRRLRIIDLTERGGSSCSVPASSRRYELCKTPAEMIIRCASDVP